MLRKIIEMKVSMERNVFEEFCSIPMDYDVDSYAIKLCEKWAKKEPTKEFTYYIDYDLLDDMSGETIGYIYEEEHI